MEPRTRSTLVVGVSLSDADAGFLPKVIGFAKRQDFAVHLVHGVESAAAAAWAETYYAADLGIAMEMLRAAEKEMEQLVAKYRLELPITGKALLSPAAAALCGEAAAQRAQAIVLGASDQIPRFLPQGFSTALTTMAVAQVPVMVLRKSIRLDLGRDELHFLIADDLAPESRGSIDRAFRLALSLGAKRVAHAHVMPEVPSDVMRKQLHRFFGTKWPDEEVDRMIMERFEETRPQLVDLLNGRAAAHRQTMTANGVAYEQLVTFGNVVDEITRLAREHRTNMALFGHHRTLHGRPLGLGKMPLHAMLQGEYVTVVIPQ
jgi:nucleotide-binding universal stress UspA family protein